MSIDRLIGRTYLNDMDAFAVEFHYLSETAARLRWSTAGRVRDRPYRESPQADRDQGQRLLQQLGEQNGSTVTRIDDHDANLIYASITMPHVSCTCSRQALGMRQTDGRQPSR